MLTILIIDDDPILVSNIAQIVEFEGYRAIVSLDGYEAIDSLQSRSVDLILCDILMLPMSGFDILAAVKSNSKTRHIPFVFITGSEWNLDQAKTTGVVAYLKKPFTFDKLLEIIKVHIYT
jgi:CheY-like chemotaxis protein